MFKYRLGTVDYTVLYDAMVRPHPPTSFPSKTSSDVNLFIQIKALRSHRSKTPHGLNLAIDRWLLMALIWMNKFISLDVLERNAVGGHGLTIASYRTV